MDDDEEFEMLREVRDCHKYVTDKQELLQVLAKISKQIPIDYVKQTYELAERTMDTDYILNSSLEYEWP